MPAKPKPPKQKKSDRKIVEEQLHDITRLLVFWRDGQQCVQSMAFGKCGGGITWGHFVPQGESGWLRFDLSNSFAQCAGHNKLHHHHESHMIDWYIARFGLAAYQAIREAHLEHSGKKRTIGELRDMLEHYIQLYENRPHLHNIETLIALGYYGELIKQESRVHYD